jgi:hypothetical protein
VGQPGFFDLEHRYAGLHAHGDPLVAINAAGRKPWDEVLIFKLLVLQALCTLSDEAMEYRSKEEAEEKLAARGFKSRVHRRASRA